MRPLTGRALVTGAAGFVGSAVVRTLLDRGLEVRALVHRDRRNLDGLPIETVTGDITSAASCAEAVHGCDAVFHVAAHYALWVREPRRMYRVNVDGTENVLRAAADAGIERIVHTSTVGAVGLPPDGSPGTERTPLSRRDVVGHYKRSKVLAEELALRLHDEEGVPVVVVNPAAPMGERDIHPTPTGQLIVDFLNDRMPAYLDTALNVVDVDDVAEGHALAAEKGQPGERYILGNRNLTLAEILGLLARITSLPSPIVRMPYGVALLAASFSELWSLATGTPPRVPLTGVRMANKPMRFDAARAFRELGLPRTPPEETLTRAVRWFAANGYVRNRWRAAALQAVGTPASAV